MSARAKILRILSNWKTGATASPLPALPRRALSAKAAAPTTAAAAASRAPHVGILAMETYVAGRFVGQEALEKFDGVSAGKYTIGAWREGVGGAWGAGGSHCSAPGLCGARAPYAGLGRPQWGGVGPSGVGKAGRA